MAGLTAALALVRRGHDVTVIEYRPRVGGRLRHYRWRADGLPRPAGAISYVLSYLRRFDLPLLGLNDGLPRYFFEGRTADAASLTDWPWDLAPEAQHVSVSTTLNRYLFLNGLDADTVLDPN